MRQRRIGRRHGALGAAVAAAFLLPAAISLSAPAQALASGTGSSSAPQCTAADHAPLPAMTSVWRANGWGSAQNEAVSARITSDQQYLSDHGVPLAQWGPDSVSNRVMVHLVRYTTAAAAIVRARYGCAVIVATGSQPLAQVTGRVNDTAPFSGGDFIVTPLGPRTIALCTGGPIIRFHRTGNATFRMLTAAHCAPGIGARVFRSNRHAAFGPHIGNVIAGTLCNGCLDTAMVNGNFGNGDPAVQLGGDNSRVKGIEDGTAFPSPFLCNGGRPGCARDLVAQDSAVTGEITGITVTGVNLTLNVRDGRRIITVVGLSEARKGNVIIQREGDSGGPWIVPVPHSGLVKIAGTAEAAGSGGRIAFFEEIGLILRQFGGFVPSP
jgi:hypothetical protein